MSATGGDQQASSAAGTVDLGGGGSAGEQTSSGGSTSAGAPQGGSGSGATAQGGDSSASAGMGGGGSASGGTESSTGGGGAGAGGASNCVTQVGVASALTIYGAGNGVCSLSLAAPNVGVWFAFDDGTHMPPPGSSVTAQNGATMGRGPTAAAGCYVQGAGPGATNWGGGLGFALNGTGDAPCVFDASAYSGIHLSLRGTTQYTEGANYAPTANLVRVNVVTTATSDTYGTCTGASGECDDHYGVWCTVGPNFALCDVPFGNLSQRGWGAVEPFDKSQLLRIQILAVRDPAGAGPTTWNVAAENVAFYQ